MSRRVCVLALTLSAASAAYTTPAPTPARAQAQAVKPRKVVKTDAEWRKLLTGQQYMVTRRKATEPAFSGKYAVSHAKGTYACVCCGAPLFSALTKFDSGTGWPSFWQPIGPKQVDSAPDFETGEPRVEVLCNDCGAHLGHVFNDGPPPTGLRYCINSLSLKLIPPAATTTAAKKGPATKTRKGQTPPSDDPPGQGPAPEDAKPSEGKDTADK